MGKVAADIVTVSHSSPNHSFTAGIGGEPRVVEGPGEYEIADVLIAGVATAEEPENGPTNTAYVVRFDDLAICHLGDLRNKLTDKQVEDIGSIDVLLVPVGAGGALGPSKAAEVVAQLEPSLVIPMHYRFNGGTVEGLEKVDPFVREMGSKEFVPQPKLSITKTTLPPDLAVVVLENKRL